jgi:tRNA 5-methylaminomethyl-2-thiouridine biosynthesis bifunctional protein
MSELYSGLKTNAKSQFSGEAPWLTGLMINTGHGSKGLVSCPIAAEILTAEILNQPYPLEYELIRILSPQRFMIRDLKRSKSE